MASDIVSLGISIPFFLAIFYTTATAAPAATQISHRPLFGRAPQSSPSLAPTTTTPAPNDPSPHDRICRGYIKKFLTGTTDSKDECLGLQDAYSAADCSDDDTDNDGSDDPWGRWWHDLIGDDDLIGDTDDNCGGGRLLGEHVVAEDGDDQIPMIDDAYENRVCCSTIRSYYAVRCPAEGKVVDPRILLITSSILIACGILKAFLWSVENPFIKSFPEAAGCILVGAVAGTIVRLAVPGIDLDRVAFDEDLLLSVFLPPIIFQATLAIDKSALGRNIISVTTFAIFGTLLSAMLTSVIVYFATKPMANPIPALDASIFGALISSIDPVSTLSVLSAAGFSETDTIYILVFGESLLNDGVAIVLFRVLLGHLHGHDGHETLKAVISAVAERFAIVSLGSICIGLTTGVACTLYFWALRGRHMPVVEVGVFFIWALVPYYIGDAVGYSSVISMMATLFFADLFVIGRHSSNAHANIRECEVGEHSEPFEETTEHSEPFEETTSQHLFSTSGQLSPVSRHHIGFVAEVVSSLMETIIFAYLGLFLFMEKSFNLPLSAIAILACVGSRAVMVGLLSWILKSSRMVYKKCRMMCCNRREIASIDEEESVDISSLPQQPRARQFLDRNTQMILFLSGIRGAVSLALVENIPVFNAVAKEGSKFKVELKTMTMSSIIFTVFAFGSATYVFVNDEGNRSSNNSGREGNPARMNEPLLGGESSQRARLSRIDDDGQSVQSVEIRRGL